MSIRKFASTFILAMVVFGSASAEPFPSREIYMVDGDTAKVAGHNYRLVGYDTPETWRPKCEYERALGQAATARARELIELAQVVDFVILPGKDKYGRGLASIYIRGVDLGKVLVNEGLARPYDRGRRAGWC